MNPCCDIDYVLKKLDWMRRESIWPNGLRYLWTDAFGVVLLASLAEDLKEENYLAQAELLVDDVYRVLGRDQGIRIGEAAGRDGQYFHYLAMWMYALSVLARFDSKYRDLGIQLVRQTHERFVIPGRGVIWKMQEDLSDVYPGYGFGALDALDGYVSYRCLDPDALGEEIEEMRRLVDLTIPDLAVTQDLGIGMMLWMTHFFPHEQWAQIQRPRCLGILTRMWRPKGYFIRDPDMPAVKFAFTNYGVSLGLQAIGESSDRVEQINRFFETWRSNDEYDREAITHVMACTAHFPGLMIAKTERPAP
jgi:hypothetical protein